MMNAFVQRLSRLQCTCSTLLRLCDRSYLQCTAASTSRKFSVSTRSYMLRAACTCSDSCRGFATLVAEHHQIVDEYRERRPFLDKVRENDYAHNIFLNSIHYANSVMKQSKTYAHVTNEETLKILEDAKQDNERIIMNEELLSKLKRVMYNMRCSKEPLDLNLYENFFNMLCKQCKNLTDNNLRIMMQCLVPFGNRFHNCSFYQILCQKVNKECVARFTQLQINDTLLLCDIIYQMMQKSNSEYIWYAMKKLGNKPNKLDRHQLVQVLFYLNVCRKPPINMYELEYRLEQLLDEISINELGIALLGFFKTGTQIRSNYFLRRIIQKTMDSIESVDSVSIGAILKLIRYSMQLTEISYLQKLLQSLTPHVPRFTLMTLTHVAHACAKVALDDQELMDKIIKRLNSEIKTARLKDIERLMFVFASLNIDPSNSIYQTVINELRTTWDTSRANEISLFPQVASRILGYLAVLSIYPIDLIKRVMTLEFLSKTCKGNYSFLTREYCVLDYSLRVEVPEYDGPFLKPVTCIKLQKKHFENFCETSLAENSRMKVLLTEVVQTCQHMFDTTSDITIIRPLPHYATPDVIFCLDKENKLVPSGNFLSQFHQSEIMRVDKNSENVRWIALALGHSGLLTRIHNLPVGHLAAKMRQLSKIGYTPILISYIQWNVCRTLEDKCNYIGKLILESKLESNT